AESPETASPPSAGSCALPDRPRTPRGARAHPPPRSIPSDTTRCASRDRRSSAERSFSDECTALLRVRRRALRGYCFLFRVVDLEHGVELRELEQFLDALRRVDENQLAVLIRELAEVADQLTDARRVDVVDLREVDDDVRALVLEHILESRREELRALPQFDQTFHVEDREIVHVLLFYDHSAALRARIIEPVANAAPRRRSSPRTRTNSRGTRSRARAAARS